jgi:hypothetical protein
MPVAILESESHRVLVAHLRRFCFLLSSIMATIRRRQVQAFIEQDRSDDPKRLQLLEPKFRQVIQTGRAKCRCRSRISEPESIGNAQID